MQNEYPKYVVCPFAGVIARVNSKKEEAAFRRAPLYAFCVAIVAIIVLAICI